MICKKCGEEISDASKFCSVCGTKIEENTLSELTPEAEVPVEKLTEETPVAETQPEVAHASESNAVSSSVDPSIAEKATGNKITDALRKVPAIVWGIVGAAILAVIVICNIVSCANNKSPFITNQAKEQIIYVSGSEIITSSGNKIKIDDDIFDYSFNYNSTVAVVRDYSGDLWAVTTKKATKIAEDVTHSYSISFYGDTIVYQVTDGKEYSVYTYDVAKKKSKKIYDDKIKEIVISPNGKYVALMNLDWDLYVSKKGATASKEYSEAYPIGISNDGKKLFYLKNNEFCMNDEKLVSYDDYISGFFFNAEGDEVLFIADRTIYYVSSKATEAIKVKGGFSGDYDVVVPENTAIFSATLSNFSVIKICGVKNFNSVVLNIGNAAFYVSEQGRSKEKIINNFADYPNMLSKYKNYIISSDGKSIIYIDDGDIYKIANLKNDSESERIGKKLDAIFIYASEDLKTIYFINSDGELRYLNKDGKGELIADDVQMLIYGDASYSYNVAYDSSIKGVVYVNTDSEVYTAQTSKKSRQKLSVGDAEGDAYIEAKGNVTYIKVYDEDDNATVYKVVSTKKVKKLATIDDQVRKWTTNNP